MCFHRCRVFVWTVRCVFFVKTELKISVFKNSPVRVSEALDRTSICEKVCFKTNE